jgi:hypothetical protein
LSKFKADNAAAMGALKAQEEVKRVQLRDKLEAKRSAKKAALEAQQRAELAAKEEVRTVFCVSLFAQRSLRTVLCGSFFADRSGSYSPESCTYAVYERASTGVTVMA